MTTSQLFSGQDVGALALAASFDFLCHASGSTIAEVLRTAEVIRVISAIFLRETLEAANNDAEMLVQERSGLTCFNIFNILQRSWGQDRLHKKAMYVRKLEGSMAAFLRQLKHGFSLETLCQVHTWKF